MFVIEHHTRYRFDRPVMVGQHLIRLRPAPHCLAPISAYTLTVAARSSHQMPARHSVDWSRDSFGNHVARLVFAQPVSEFSVDIGLKLEASLTWPFALFVAEPASHYPFEYDSRVRSKLEPYLRIVESGPPLREWLATLYRGERCYTEDFLAGINRRVCDRVSYCARMQHGVQSCEQTLRLQSGSCRDSAWLLVQVLRYLGFAARFVSGYLLQSIDDQSAKDSIELHAWVEVFLPGPGWIGLDSTSGLFTAAGHIPLACAPEPLAAAPVSGRIGKCSVMLEFRTAVSRIN